MTAKYEAGSNQYVFLSELLPFLMAKSRHYLLYKISNNIFKSIPSSYKSIITILIN